jgi:hypothetical protein
MTDQLINGILAWFAKTLLSALGSLWDLLASTAFVSPDVTQLPQVTAFAGTSLSIVNVCYVLAFLWMAIQVLGRDTIQARYGPGELIPRLIIGLIAANLALPLCSTLIQSANAVTAALTSQDITSPGSMTLLRTTVTNALSNQDGANPSSFLLLLVGVFIAVLAGILLVQWIVRLGVLVVAVGIAPVALALHGTPQTEGAAKLWWRTVLGTLGTVVIQAVALHTTLTIFLNPRSNLRVLGLPSDGGTLLNLLIVVCLLWGVIKIPSLMRRFVTQTKSGVGGQIFRIVVMQQLTRGLSRAFAAHTSTARRTASAGRTVSDPPWPTTRSGGRSLPPATGGAAARLAASARRLPPPSGSAPGRVGIAYPSGRAVRPYTPDELASGVDVYTRAMKTRGAASGRTTP